MVTLAIGESRDAGTFCLHTRDLRVIAEGGTPLLQRVDHPLHDLVHAALHIVVAVVPEFGVGEQAVDGHRVEGGASQEESHQRDDLPCFL
ncbi:hypothetical protein SDC9_134847 [bioreactor metagenome]|uniref:Uncharacterized protein n=1 Tax=bioreactor metagenome TaxID=1076179 RepID=A0A645DEQ3_9ZZZZ